MKTFTVCNALELGVAVTESKPGDVISISSGDYAIVPLKSGVSVEFPEDYSVKVAFIPFCELLASKFRSSNIKFDDISLKNVNKDSEIIRGIYVYRKRLPFEVHFEGVSYLHPNGSFIKILGNDKSEFSIGATLGGSDRELPKGVIQVEIPFLDDVKMPIELSYGLDDEIGKFENRNPAPGCYLNDFEYLALWSINSFIMIYGKMTKKEKKISGYSTSEFKDDLEFGRANDIADLTLVRSSYVDNISSTHEINHSSIQTKLLGGNVFSLSNYIEEQLNRLNYSQAVIAMSDFINEFYGDGFKKYKNLESSSLHDSDKTFLVEVLLVRNALLHFQQFALIDKVDDYSKLKSKYPRLREISEFEIFASKRPWFWYEAFNKWKTLGVELNLGHN